MYRLSEYKCLLTLYDIIGSNELLVEVGKQLVEVGKQLVEVGKQFPRK